jgi:hypothetical protein
MKQIIFDLNIMSPADEQALSIVASHPCAAYFLSSLGRVVKGCVQRNLKQVAK